MNFAWDRTKAARNLAKHGVSFDEAATGFDDPLYLDFFDPEHSEQGRILVVSYTEREGVMRLISARPATRKEREAYEEN